ncbi:phosphonate ABC transporter substrate-binding protein [Pelomonas sp. KK5]|uniref:phosphonate ABC transporter substrate-binding protein n=1 Tax=Pelomonas sp. KK5 TaxID=1855730 RepID=UPI003513FB6F
MRRHTLLALLAAGLLATTAQAQQQAPKEISFGFISTEASNNLRTAWQPLLQDMEKATGLSVKAFFASDYAGIIEAMRFNKIQLAWMGNKSAMEAVDRSNGEVFAKTIAKDGTEGYYSLLIVHKDSPLKSLDNVVRQHASLTLGFGDPNSTSGTAVPGLFAFQQNKLDPARDFKRMVRASHEANLLAVVNRQVDVATNNTENTSRFEKTHPEQAADVRVIWRSPLIPSDPLVWRKDLDAGTKKAVREFLLGYGRDAREKAVLANIEYSAIRASSDAQLVPIRQIELARERSRVESDTTLSAEDRAKKLKDLDGRLAELGRAASSS